MRKRAALVLVLVLVSLSALVGVLTAYRRPCREIVEQCGVSTSIVYAVIKAESGFREDAVSDAGAVGIMQLMPSTAEFVCRREGISFEIEKLFDAEYNIALGCLYLKYLLEKFTDTATAIAAYNAGEGVVSEWLKNEAYSQDGVHLSAFGYPETGAYVKKVKKYAKIYDFIYH